MDSALAERLFRAYRQGLLYRSSTELWRRQQFDVLFRQVFWLKVPLRERLQIQRIWRLSSSGLRLSRERRLEEAFEAFCACWSELGDGQISPSGRLLATTFLESCQSYFEHKRGAYHMARTRVLNAMEADLELEEDGDFSLLELHRIQSAHNLVRIDLRAGQQHRAMLLAGQTLAYLEGFLDYLPVHHSWKSTTLQTLTPRSIRRELLAQIANETVIAFSYFPGAGLEDEFLANVQFARYLDTRPVLHQPFGLWVLAKRAFLQQNWDEYLPRLLDFLPSGRPGISPIWYSAVLDLLTLCRELDSRISRYLHDGILGDTGKWPGLPPSFRPLIGLPSDGEQANLQPSFQAAGFHLARAGGELGSRHRE